MKLQDRLDTFRKDMETQIPKEALVIMHRATEDLRNSGILDRTVKVGDKAPDFILKNTKGQEVGLSQLLEKGPVVLGFYRGRW
jgi:hypothetical protein